MMTDSTDSAQEGQQFEFVLENDDSTTTVLTPHGNQTIEEMLRDLKISSGKLRIRCVTPLPPQPSKAVIASAAGGDLLTEDDRQIPMTVDDIDIGWGKREERQKRRDSLPANLDDVLGAAVRGLGMNSSLPVLDREKTADDSSIPKRGLRPLMNKRCSMRELAHLDSFSDARGQTQLHRICSSKSIDYKRLEDLVERFPNLVRHKDSNGRLPLHLLSMNSDLIKSYSGQMAATKSALLLMDTYPDGIVVADTNGRMPFTYLILKWVEWVFENSPQSESTRLSSPTPLGMLSRRLLSSKSLERQASSGSVTKTSFNGLLNLDQMEGTPDKVSDLRESLDRSSNRFPPVMIFEEVEWCFEILSRGMDHLGGKPLDPGKQVRPTLSYNKQRKQRKQLARNIAEIPGLLKTVLLIESKQTRSFILNCSAIRRTLFCTEVIGPWLTTMIQYSNGNASDVGLDFLQTLSSLNVEDYVGGYRKAQPVDRKMFQKDKLGMYKSVEKLGDVVPTLVITGQKATDKGVATPLVNFIMNRQMATPFTVGAGIGEFFLHLCAMLAYRQLVLPGTNEEEFSKLFPWMELEHVIFWVASHELAYKLCEFVAISRISKRGLKNAAFGLWSMAESLGMVLALWASVYLGRKGKEIDSPFLLAFILGLLWIRILAFLKVVNEHLATFVLALTKLLFDIRFFGIVFFIFVLMFGDMFRLVVNDHDDIDCSNADAMDSSIGDFCSEKISNSYLRTYAIVVGDFNLEDYNDLQSVTFLWFCTTFLGTIVLVNVLIAVVTLSFASSQESSVILFRRARAQFLASHAVMERFIRPSHAGWSDKMSTFSCSFICLISLRWVLLGTWITAIFWSSLYVVDLVTYTVQMDLPLLAIPYILLASGMFVQLWCATNLLVVVLVEQICPPGKCHDLLLGFFESSSSKIITPLISRLYGTDRKDTESGAVAVGLNSEVLARLDRLENLLETIYMKKQKEDDGVQEVQLGFEDSQLSPLQETDVDELGESYRSDH